MMLLQRLGAAAAAVAVLGAQSALAQMTAGTYTDAKSGITFSTWTSGTASDPDSTGTQVDYTWGIALPDGSLKKDATEYIGLMRCSIAETTNGTGWCGLSHGSAGQMTNSLLLMAWPSNGQVFTSFRYATGYFAPVVYTGNATLTQISSTVNSSMFEVLYRCQNCFSWDQAGATGNVSTSAGYFIMGRAAAATGLTNAQCPNNINFGFHDGGYGQYGAPLDNATNTQYSSWAALATKTVTTNCATGTATTTTSTGTATSVPPTGACTAVPTGTSYDYIIVGGGAGGLPMADKLTAAGKSVLLIERGPPSTGRWNGTMKPAWLEGTDLTRFDVPGLCNQIWHDSTGVACVDTDQMEGCVLGGGTAVNAGLWWKPNPQDWDVYWPKGWQSKDVVDATNRVFNKIPGTWHPSTDGQLYKQEGFNVLSTGLNASGYQFLIPNDNPTRKNRTYGHTTYMYSNGERGGPLATYLVTASQRSKFTMWTNAEVRRLVRTGGHITGVELGCTTIGQHSGFVNVTKGTGRVILAGGTFGTAKVLMRSGIGPSDQLDVVASSAIDNGSMISKDQWINLPVGYNLMDHLNTDLIVAHPNVSFYDFYAAWDNPIAADKAAYLSKRTGILAQAAPNIGPMIWEEIKGSDGIVRQLQWTSRVEGNDNINPSKYSMTMSQYLGRGSVSRGRMTINGGLNTQVSTTPYLHNDGDLEAVIKGIKNIQAALAHIPNLTWIQPAANQTVEDYVASLPVTPGARRANHWMGTAKIGTDDGRKGGNAVVDLNTKVYGTDNLFVVDASIFPGMMTGNPSAMIVIAAEHAYDKIIASPAPTAGKMGAQCGGQAWTGSFSCQDSNVCGYVSKDLSACVSSNKDEALAYIKKNFAAEFAKGQAQA